MKGGMHQNPIIFPFSVDAEFSKIIEGSQSHGSSLLLPYYGFILLSLLTSGRFQNSVI